MTRDVRTAFRASVAATVACVVALSWAPAAAAAEPGAADPDAYAHDGFFFQVAMGYAHMRLDSSVDGGRSKLRTEGLASTVLLGGSPVRDLVLFAGVFTYAFNRKPASGARPEGLSMGAIGLGAAYYQARWNVFASAMIALEGGDPAIMGRDTRFAGPLHRFALGKEWWVGPQWGVGVTVECALGRRKGDWLGRSWSASTGAFGFGFSATYQ